MLTTLLAGGAFATQVAYWSLLHIGFRRARRRGTLPQRNAPPRHQLPPMSVIVAARDEEAVLPDLLRALAAQTHPRYELIVVDDASDDATAEAVRRHAARHSHVRLVQVEQPHTPRKKHALTLGIDAARYELLAFTDADCAPPPRWLETLARHHAAAPHDRLLTGYSPYRLRRDALSRTAAYETFVTGFLTAAAAGLKRPYMAVGRSMSYPKHVFQRIGGFEHSLQSLSGDDDLLVQEVRRRGAAETIAVLDEASFVPTDAPASWLAWLRQKRRHASAGRFYARDTQAHLALFQGSGLLLWSAPLWAGLPGVALLLGRLGLQTLILADAARTLDERRLLPALPLLELAYAAHNLIVAPLGLARVPEEG